MLKCDKFKEISDWHPSNIWCIDFTFDVSKLEMFKEVIDLDL